MVHLVAALGWQMLSAPGAPCGPPQAAEWMISSVGKPPQHATWKGVFESVDAGLKLRRVQWCRAGSLSGRGREIGLSATSDGSGVRIERWQEGTLASVIDVHLDDTPDIAIGMTISAAIEDMVSVEVPSPDMVETEQPDRRSDEADRQADSPLPNSAAHGGRVGVMAGGLLALVSTVAYLAPCFALLAIAAGAIASATVANFGPQPWASYAEPGRLYLFPLAGLLTLTVPLAGAGLAGVAAGTAGALLEDWMIALATGMGTAVGVGAAIAIGVVAAIALTATLNYAFLQGRYPQSLPTGLGFDVTSPYQHVTLMAIVTFAVPLWGVLGAPIGALAGASVGSLLRATVAQNSDLPLEDGGPSAAVPAPEALAE